MKCRSDSGVVCGDNGGATDKAASLNRTAELAAWLAEAVALLNAVDRGHENIQAFVDRYVADEDLRRNGGW